MNTRTSTSSYLVAVAALTISIFSASCTNDGSSESQPNAETELEIMTTIGSIERLHPALDALVPADAVIEVLSDGHEWTEGPVWVPALQSVLYSDIPNNAIYKWTEGETASVWLQPAGYTGDVPRGGESGSNGLILNEGVQRRMAQHGDRRIARSERIHGHYVGVGIAAPV